LRSASKKKTPRTELRERLFPMMSKMRELLMASSVDLAGEKINILWPLLFQQFEKLDSRVKSLIDFQEFLETTNNFVHSPFLGYFGLIPNELSLKILMFFGFEKFVELSASVSRIQIDSIF